MYILAIARLKSNFRKSRCSPLQSNFSTTLIKVDPQTVEYPEVWIKETQAFGTQSVNIEQQGMIEKTAPILHKIKERPTILFATPEDRMLGITQMAVDNHKSSTVTKWLREHDVAFAQEPTEDVPLETKKGLTVFNLVNSSIPEPVSGAMTRKFGEVIESETEYQQKVKALPDRPKYLKPPKPQVISTSEPIVPSVAIRGKPIPMNFPLMLYGEQNPLPVNTCIDAMRGYGRTHTTRAYEPYKQYGFQEGEIAIASSGDKQVAFRVGKQYQITLNMIVDRKYQQQWSDMEKHSPLALPELFNGKQQVWGLHMEPLGDYVDGKIVPFPEVQTHSLPNQGVENQSVTIDNLRSWYSAADKLGKSTEYKQRIVEVANQFKSDGQLSQSALTAMGQDKQELDSISRLTQIAQRVGAVWGQVRDDGFTHVKGKVYDVTFNAEQKDLAIAHSNGEVILSLQSGKVHTNKVTTEVLQAFEQVNNQIDAIRTKNKGQEVELQR
ncbi:hypothetical protein A6770_39100 [Nostoc minutum NIES-26]|uniref:Uncharacterized protein n=1 Tax=Nostoc minutum NIES-26 TaxID=1844469 RepID=A0A367RTU9_9NOSO|nr:hypothetical protein A6770_39100 [Nostoc minutum NIES-26]